MNAAMRDRIWMGASVGLLLLGIAGWWRLTLSPRTADRIDLPILAVWLSAAAIVAAVVWLMDHQQGLGWSPLVTSLTLAATAPLSVFPLVMPGNAGTVARAGLILASIAVLPLAWTLAGWIARPREARVARVVAVVCVASAVLVLIGIGPARNDGYLGTPVHQIDPWGLRWLLVGAATVVPGLLAASSSLDRPSQGSGSDRSVVAVVLAGAGVLPVLTSVALVSYTIWPALVIPVAAALAMVAILGRLAIGPLARAAGASALQRDLVVAASDSERVRLASALHDGPLGDVALLVQRLDSAGDQENAALARSIADELRDVGNDLRLPIVEDLGVGAALEWLVERLAQSSGTSIELDVQEPARPPAAVEAAVYLIAQEALRNALRHGAPPLTTRYVASGSALSLEVDDAGPGIPDGAAERAQREGSLGLLMMRQRADAIGAGLEIGPSLAGGTSVRLAWLAGPR